MKATRTNFKKLMESLDIDQIKDLMLSTRNESTGSMFREIGFEIIEERAGEEESDRIYSDLWKLARA